MARRGLRQRLVLGMLGYVALASVAVVAYGFVINEQAERLLWQALLQAEFDHIQERRQASPQYRWTDTETLALYGDSPSSPLPPALAALPPGLHDEVTLGRGQVVAMVRDVDGVRQALVLDITDFERREVYMVASVLGAMLVLVVVLGVLAAWSVDRLVRPLRELATGIGGLSPDRGSERIALDPGATTEIAVISEALNDYLHRNALFVERERAFINSASHELRTPISVIAGAAELAAAQPGLPPGARQQLSRIRRTSDEMERMVALLLVLAKDPARLVKASDEVALDQLLPEIVEDHRAMAEEKGLALVLATPSPCTVVAPLPVLQAAIGNLLRNAIENSDSGEIHIRLGGDGVVEITDPGHGMSPEEISAIYARMARGGARDGAGIGLELIARLCEHLGWRLSFESQRGRGTAARLELRPPGLQPHA